MFNMLDRCSLLCLFPQKKFRTLKIYRKQSILGFEQHDVVELSHDSPSLPGRYFGLKNAGIGHWNDFRMSVYKGEIPNRRGFIIVDSAILEPNRKDHAEGISGSPLAEYWRPFKENLDLQRLIFLKDEKELMKDFLNGDILECAQNPLNKFESWVVKELDGFSVEIWTTQQFKAIPLLQPLHSITPENYFHHNDFSARTVVVICAVIVFMGLCVVLYQFK